MLRANADLPASAQPEVLVISASHGENLALAGRFAEAARQQGAEAAVLDLTSAIAWLSVKGSDFRALFNSRPW